MGLTDAGAAAAGRLIAGDATILPFNAANAYVAVGDGNTAFLSTQTDLQGSNKTRKLVDSVTINSGGLSVDYTATYSTAQANYAWLEIAVTNAPSGGIMLSRKVISLPAKTNLEQWTITATVVYSAAP
jgi:hypothetical protein